MVKQPKKTNIRARIDTSLHIALKQLARDNNLSYSELVEKALDLLRREGVIITKKIGGA